MGEKTGPTMCIFGGMELICIMKKLVMNIFNVLLVNRPPCEPDSGVK